MTEEQKQILEAVTKFRTETDKEFDSVRESYTAMLSELVRIQGSVGGSQVRIDRLEGDSKLCLEFVITATRDLELLEKRADELTGRIALLESAIQSGGMAVQQLAEAVSSLQDGLYAAIKDQVAVEAEKAVEAYVAARKKQKPAIVEG